MFSLAILIGIYSYLIFCLGISGLLYKINIIILTVVYFGIILYWQRLEIKALPGQIKLWLSKAYKLVKTQKLILLIAALIAIQAAVNLIGVLGPEISFDALWYHLTLPKIYLNQHLISYIPGGLLYYSEMPKAIEMLYTAALAIQGQILAKFIHFIFGILDAVIVYKLSNKFMSKRVSLIACLIFYTNLVVGWESVTAYIDLARTFFEILSLWGFLNWYEKRDRKWLIESAVMLGLAITVKVLSATSIIIFLILFFYIYLTDAKSIKKNYLKDILIFILICFAIPFPYFFISILNTGSPFYPFFTKIYQIGFNLNLLNPSVFIKDVFGLFTHAADPVSPLYLIFLPIIIFFAAKANRLMKIIMLYSLLAIFIWYLIPRPGAGRFILPYLPALSICVGYAIEKISRLKSIKIFSFIIIFFIAFLSVGYRLTANAKFIPVILKKESKAAFLSSHLNFSYGDFYDTDNYLKTHIKPFDTVLLYGFHNLYYIDFPFVDSSFIKKGQVFDYIATQNTNLPKQYENWKLIYYNPKTKVKLYYLKGEKWVY